MCATRICCASSEQPFCDSLGGVFVSMRWLADAARLDAPHGREALALVHYPGERSALAPAHDQASRLSSALCLCGRARLVARVDADSAPARLLRPAVRRWRGGAAATTAGSDLERRSTSDGGCRRAAPRPGGGGDGGSSGGSARWRRERRRCPAGGGGGGAGGLLRRSKNAPASRRSIASRRGSATNEGTMVPSSGIHPGQRGRATTSARCSSSAPSGTSCRC